MARAQVVFVCLGKVGESVRSNINARGKHVSVLLFVLFRFIPICFRIVKLTLTYLLAGTSLFSDVINVISHILTFSLESKRGTF